MTLDELLAGFKEQYGDTWPSAVLDKFSYLNGKAFLRPNDKEEHLLLWRWVEDMVVAGVKATEEQ